MPRRHDNGFTRQSELGFTLMELLVVIGIFVVLSAIMVPIGTRLRDGNRTSTCQAQLTHLGTALKAYFLDEGGVPPIGVPGTINAGVPTPGGTTVDFAAWPSLQSLFVLGYLKDRSTLHCPRHTKDSSSANLTIDSPEYYTSYISRDPRAKPSGSPLLQYKYMPFRYRWAGQPAYVNDARRTLTTNILQVNIGGTETLVTGVSSSEPPDDTIITWCNYHADNYKVSGHGQYVALYWDGSVKLLDQELFRDATISPPEAWMVKPTDIAH